MNTTTKEFRKKLTIAFKKLRKLGYFAKQRHTCCNTCGWAEIPDGRDDKAVFYHLQDNDSLLSNDSKLNLSWSGNHEEIIGVLKSVGIEASCENPPYKKIVCLTGNPDLSPSVQQSIILKQNGFTPEEITQMLAK